MKKLLLVFLTGFYISYALTLEEAIKRVKKVSPLYHSYQSQLIDTFYQYKTWISPFLPSVSYAFSYTKSKHTDPDFFLRRHIFQINWNIYDSGQSIFNRKILKYTYLSAKEDFKENVLDILYNVKLAYMRCAASKEVVSFRKAQLKSAKFNLDVAKRKKKLGLVKKSDVLQALVRYENAKYALQQAENQYKKNLAELNSWLRYPLDRETDIDMEDFYLYADNDIPPFYKIEDLALRRRPLLKSMKYTLKVYKNNVKKTLALFSPYMTLSFSRQREFSSIYGENEYTNSYSVSLNWNIFSGFQRYYSYLSSREKEKNQKFKILETKRQIRLSLFKTYTDLKTAIARLKVAKALLKEADQNYKQALGEYKVGTGDILSLLRAEENLASAHETYINTLLDIAISRITLERQMGIQSIRGAME